MAHAPQGSLVVGSSNAVPTAAESISAGMSSNAPFFLVFLSFFPNPPQSSMSAASVGFGSLISSTAPSPKSNPVLAVFFLFFLLPPKLQTPPSPPSKEVSFVPFVLSVTSAVPVSVVARSHLLEVFQLLPQPPKPKLEPVSLRLVSPKLKSSFGESPRLISSKVPNEGLAVAAGSGLT